MITGAHLLLYSKDPEADRGIKTTIRLPGGGELGLYQPTHPTAF
jgi:hypothetical protein